MGRGVGHATTSARTVNHTALSLASSLRIASGTSSPCSFVDTRSGEGGAADAGVDGSHGLACLSCLPSRFWCAHNKHNAARQQNPAMHAMMMPAISPDAIAARSPRVAHPHGRFDADRRGEARHGKELNIDDLLRRLDDRDHVVDRVLHDALRQLVGGDAVDDDDESAVGGAQESEEEPGFH